MYSNGVVLQHFPVLYRQFTIRSEVTLSVIVYSKASCLELSKKALHLHLHPNSDCISSVQSLSTQAGFTMFVGERYLGLARVGVLAPDASHWACVVPIPCFCCQQHAGSRTALNSVFF